LDLSHGLDVIDVVTPRAPSTLMLEIMRHCNQQGGLSIARPDEQRLIFFERGGNECVVVDS
jgi:hypothetical protein